MTGIRIYGQATFREMFRPVLHRLNGLVWVVSEGQWRFPQEWHDTSNFDAAAERYTTGPLADFQRDFQRITEAGHGWMRSFGYLATADIFPKYADAIGDDGLCIFGLRMAPAQAIEWLKKDFWGAPGYAAAVVQAEVSFIGHESWWEFYARETALREALEAHLPHRSEWDSLASPKIAAAYEECTTE